MIVLDFLLYSSYRFCRAIRGQTPKSLATCNVSFVFSFHLTYLSELIAKYAFGLRLQDFINVAVGTMIAFYIILILLYMRTRRNNCGYDNMEEKFKTRSFHKTSFYVLVTLGMLACHIDYLLTALQVIGGLVEALCGEAISMVGELYVQLVVLI